MHDQDADRSSFFLVLPPSSWHTGKACEIPFEVHQCAHFKVHLPEPLCTLTDMSRGDPISQQKSGWKEHNKQKMVHVWLCMHLVGPACVCC